MYHSTEYQSRWLAGAGGPGGQAPSDAALRRFQRAQSQAAWATLWDRLRGRAGGLLTVEALIGGRALRGAREGGLRSVPIAQIVASEGRVGDFDRRFRPLHGRSWDRWREVALALAAGAALPPVELIQVGERYAVRDGHHRISAAAAHGQAAVDARVTVLEL